MRTVYLFNMLTLDGFFEGDKKWALDWHNVDAEFNQFAIEQLQRTGLLIFGRMTYDGMASYWTSPEGKKDDPIVAGLMNSIPKVVFSRTLQSADWENTTLVKTDPIDAIRTYKGEEGKDIAILGSADLASILLQENVIDEVRVIINPVVLGTGNRLFKESNGRKNLKLVRSKVFASGNVLLCYRPIA